MCSKIKEDSYRDFVLDQLRSLEDVTCRAMFGGYGLYPIDLRSRILRKTTICGVRAERRDS
jgi:hypothetical protein